MTEITFVDRATKKLNQEKVYGAFFLDLLYGDSTFAKFFSNFFRSLTAKWKWTSHFYGWLQKTRLSRYKIVPFIKKFGVDETEFLDPVDSFKCFNDFFIRKLKPSARPITQGHDVAIIPADGRVLVFQNIEKCEGFFIKGVKFSLREFLLNDELSSHYANGSMAIIRLAPCDYHRFHFPFNCLPQPPELIDGTLYSVNPMALKKDISILTRNKRERTALNSKFFGHVQYVEIGATHVGTIHQTFIASELYAKGDEKGYFSFGGSCIVLLFEPGRIQFDQDLLESSQKNIETRCLMGQTLGRALNIF
jgi:phosphatidylserine decarboxylase